MSLDKKQLILSVTAAYPALYNVYYNTAKRRLCIHAIPTAKIECWLYIGGSARADYNGILYPLNGLFISDQGAQDYINRENGDGFNDRFDRTPEWRAIVKYLYNARRASHNV